MKEKRRFLAMLTALMLMFSIVSCAPTTDQGAKSEAPEAEHTETAQTPSSSGGTLVWNIGSEPKTWDPQINTSGAGGHVIINLYEGLMRDTQDGIMKAQAQDYKIEANSEGVENTLYTFTLRDDLKWSDGKPVTAHDYEYAWKRAADPNLASPYAFLVTDYIKGAKEYFDGVGKAEDMKVKALDDKTLQVELINPTAYFLNLISFFTYMPVREDMATTGEGWEKDPAKCITNGAFKLSEYKIGSHLTMVKNEEYWDKDNVSLSEIKALFITDATTSLQGYQAGEIHITSLLPREEVPKLLAEDPNFSSEKGLGLTYYAINVDKEPFNDVNVRKALALAIDRKTLVEQVRRSGEIPAAAFVAPKFKTSDGKSFRPLDENEMVVPEFEIDPWAAQVDKAKEYLAKAGFPDGKGFPEFDLVYYIRTDEQKVAEAIQQMWEKNLGIKVNLVSVEASVFNAEQSAGKYSVSQSGWSADYNDPMTMLALFTSNGLNSCHWRWKEYAGSPHDKILNESNKAYDELVAKAIVSTGTERDDIMKEAEKVLMDEMIIIPLYYESYTQVLDRTKVDGPGRTPIGQWDFKPYKMIN